MAAARIHKDPTVFLNAGTVAHPVLGLLGDVFAWPAPLPLANTFSIGDLLIVAGVAYGAHRISGSRLGRLVRPGPPERDGATEAGPDGGAVPDVGGSPDAVPGAGPDVGAGAIPAAVPVADGRSTPALTPIPVRTRTSGPAGA